MEQEKTSIFGKLILLLFIAGCFYGAYFFFFKKSSSPTKNSGSQTKTESSSGAVEIGIAYGTEKKRWLENAVDQFASTSEGKNIKVNLIPMGSLEGAQSILAGNKQIQVWSPASAAYKDIFLEEWSVKYSGNPIYKEDALALTPMVFVMWDERYQAFIQKYKAMNFSTIAQALQEKTGWEGIAQKPEWGLFKFGHTHPNQSNSGLLTLVLMAYDYHKKTKGLTLHDILDPGFQDWMKSIENGISSFPNSTGNLMREMILKGPSSYDAVFVYESVAIDYLKSAEGRWGNLKIIYPQYNMWNENPYYIIQAPWVSSDQHDAAEAFLKFLLSDQVQKDSLNHGFRPGNPTVPIKFAGSPFVQYATFGLRVDLSNVAEPPRAEVINNLLASWQRSEGSR